MDNVPKETIASGNSGEGKRRKGSGNKEERVKFHADSYSVKPVM